jgi:NADH-quinone oxidoreductase subunit K
MISIYSFIELGLIILFLGCCGVLINKKNILITIISIELMFYGLNFFLLTLSVELNDIVGQVFSLLILTLAAAESALSLGIITVYFRVYENIFIL